MKVWQVWTDEVVVLERTLDTPFILGKNECTETLNWKK